MDRKKALCFQVEVSQQTLWPCRERGILSCVYDHIWNLERVHKRLRGDTLTSTSQIQTPLQLGKCLRAVRKDTSSRTTERRVFMLPEHCERMLTQASMVLHAFASLWSESYLFTKSTSIHLEENLSCNTSSDGRRYFTKCALLLFVMKAVLGEISQFGDHIPSAYFLESEMVILSQRTELRPQLSH